MADVSKIPLPEVAHVPGKNTRPDSEFMDEICKQADAITSDAGSSNNLPWIYGIRLFNHGFYWEAHEVWESVWIKAPPNSREKIFIQGIIHFANGLLKIRMERQGAARRLFDLTSECIDNALLQYPQAEQEQFMTINLVRLRDELQCAKQSGGQEFMKKLPKYEL